MSIAKRWHVDVEVDVPRKRDAEVIRAAIMRACRESSLAGVDVYANVSWSRRYRRRERK